ncbi:MAG: exo-alpha-sialidase [Phycisphaeraceae bacterium]|nr:exo-alpha-sialidase [Phycisphaeraceae bacterium]
MVRITNLRLKIIGLAALLALAGSAHAAVLQQTVVFQQGENGYHAFRIPALVKAANGDLLAFAEGRVNSTSDTGNIDIVMKRSSNGGLSWDSLQVVRSDGGNTVGNPVPILDAATGNLVLLETHNLGQDTQDEIYYGTSDGTRTTGVQTCSDNGATWSAATEITHCDRHKAAT